MEDVSTEKIHYENCVWRNVSGRGMWVRLREARNVWKVVVLGAVVRRQGTQTEWWPCEDGKCYMDMRNHWERVRFGCAGCQPVGVSIGHAGAQRGPQSWHFWVGSLCLPLYVLPISSTPIPGVFVTRAFLFFSLGHRCCSCLPSCFWGLLPHP